MTSKKFIANDIIFKQGSKAESMFLVEKGEVVVYFNYGKKDETEIATIGEKKYFGEMGVIENTKRSATVVAKTDVELIEIDKESFPKFVAENPSDAIKIMQALSANLRATTERYFDACKSISELVDNEENKGKKGGIWEKLHKFAEEYSEVYKSTDEIITPYWGQQYWF